MHDLTGRVAIVSGAGSVGPGWGNGKATAVLLARQGASVFLLDINEAAARETAGIIEGEGGKCAVHRTDMLDSASVQEMVQACLDRFKRIDILVNNVGGSEPGSVETLSEEAWDRQIDFNAKTAFLGCKYVVPVMLAQERIGKSQGAIVNTASVAGIRVSGARPQVGYTASKSAVIGLTKSVAAAYAKQGIRCNTVIPGLMHTPLVEYRLARQIAGNDAEALIAKRNSQVPMGRMGTGWDVANATLFLVSDEANFITGTEIIVDGGFSCFGPGGS
ncbi:MAG: SDR family oxidoreductase [Proteobacteria bacterium]|nr:SDR family oxidoreductase [Pseudomonadota bacterium]